MFSPVTVSIPNTPYFGLTNLHSQITPHDQWNELQNNLQFQETFQKLPPEKQQEILDAYRRNPQLGILAAMPNILGKPLIGGVTGLSDVTPRLSSDLSRGSQISWSQFLKRMFNIAHFYQKIR